METTRVSWTIFAGFWVAAAVAITGVLTGRLFVALAGDALLLALFAVVIVRAMRRRDQG